MTRALYLLIIGLTAVWLIIEDQQGSGGRITQWVVKLVPSNAGTGVADTVKGWLGMGGQGYTVTPPSSPTTKAPTPTAPVPTTGTTQAPANSYQYNFPSASTSNPFGGVGY